MIETRHSLTLVDTGAPQSLDIILRHLKKINRNDLGLILITHAHVDHYGCANSLRSVTGAKIAVHQADMKDLSSGNTRLGSARGIGKMATMLLPLFEMVMQPTPTKPDVILTDGDSLAKYNIEGVVIHTPGHTMGSCSLLVKERYAFVGDLISSSSQPRVQKYFAQDWSLIPRSVERIKAANPELVYMGHGANPIDNIALQLL